MIKIIISITTILVLFNPILNGQEAERFDSLEMIIEMPWMNKVRERIFQQISTIEECGLIIVETTEGSEEQFGIILLRHSWQKIEDAKDPLSQTVPDVYSVICFDENPKKAKGFASISFDKYSELINMFEKVVNEAKINAMPSQSSADKKYYIFSRIIDTERKIAAGLFHSCVLVAPEANNPVLNSVIKIKSLINNCE